MGKKINQLSPVADATAMDSTQLLPLADPTTGIAGKVTVAQLKLTLIAKVLKYVASGAEGTSIVIPTIAGKQVLLVTRESAILYQVSAAPDSTEFTWDNTTIGVSLATTSGERFNIIYANA